MLHVAQEKVPAELGRLLTPRRQELSHSLMESLMGARAVSQQQMRGQNELRLWEQKGSVS